MAAQLFIRWSRLGVCQRLLEQAQARGVEPGMAFLDGTNVRAYARAAGARKKGLRHRSATSARRSDVRAVATARRHASSPTGAAGRSPSR
jgi:hypothetical protein